MLDVIRKNKKWIIAGIALIGFIYISVLLMLGKINVYDDFVYKLISKLITPKITKIEKIITNLAGFTVIISLLVIISLFFFIKYKDIKTGFLFCANISVISLINLALKYIFARPRPTGINLIVQRGYSYPSGHSITSIVFYGYLIYLINTKCKKKSVKILSTIVFTVLIILVGLSRIYLGVHFASDVTAAFLLGIIHLIVYTHVTKNIKLPFIEKLETKLQQRK